LNKKVGFDINLQNTADKKEEEPLNLTPRQSRDFNFFLPKSKAKNILKAFFIGLKL
jgi:hypothetical protein